MKTFACTVLLILMGVASAGRADEPTLERVMALARKDPANAPLVIEYAVEDSPRLLVPLVQAAVQALPERAAAIVGGLMKAVHKGQAERLTEAERREQFVRQREILRVAIGAAPALAGPLLEMALTRFPGHATAWVETALAAVPEAQRPDLAARAKKLTEGQPAAPAGAPMFEQKTKKAPARSTSFPIQPIRPDLVSPSS